MTDRIFYSRSISNGMKRVISIGILVFVIMSVFVPYIASARELFYIWGGTTCAPGTEGPTDPCGLCDALIVGRNIIEDMFKVAFILATIFIAYGGFRLMTAGGNEKNVTTAKSIIQSAVVGLLIALVAWLLINTIITSLANGNATAAWNNIECGTGGSISGPRETIGGGVTNVNTGGWTTGSTTFTGGGGQFGGGGSSGSWTTGTSTNSNNNGSTSAQINQALTSSCKTQAETCVKESKNNNNPQENPQVNINLEAAYQISCKKVGTGYNAQLQFRCLTPIVPPWKKCADGLPDLTKICK